MASIHKEGSKYRLKWREHGKAHSRTLASKSEAMAHKREIEAKVKAQKAPRHGEKLTLSALFERWLAQRKNQQYTAKDKRTLQVMLEGHMGWDKPADIDRDGFLSLPIGQYRLARAALAYGQAIGQDIPATLLASKRPRNGKKPEPDLLSDEHVEKAQALADRWGPCYGLAVHLVSTYGHRPASLIACTVAALDVTAQSITLPIKGGDIHRHIVLDETIQRWTAASKGRAAGEPILLHKGGTAWKSSTSLTSWYYHQIGGTVHPHDCGMYALKRWAITRLLDRGIDAKTIASITGHRTPSLLINTYSRTKIAKQQAALDALKVPLSSVQKS